MASSLLTESTSPVFVVQFTWLRILGIFHERIRSGVVPAGSQLGGRRPRLWTSKSFTSMPNSLLYPFEASSSIFCRFSCQASSFSWDSGERSRDL